MASVVKLAFGPGETKQEPETLFGGGRGGVLVHRVSRGSRGSADGRRESQGGKTGDRHRGWREAASRTSRGGQGSAGRRPGSPGECAPQIVRGWDVAGGRARPPRGDVIDLSTGGLRKRRLVPRKAPQAPWPVHRPRKGRGWAQLPRAAPASWAWPSRSKAALPPPTPAEMKAVAPSKV